MRYSRVHASAMRADLPPRKATLEGSDLSGANLSGANLRHSDLRRSELSGTNLTAAILRGADLRHANLAAANLCRADATRTQFDAAQLAGVILGETYLLDIDLGPLIECEPPPVLAEWSPANADVAQAIRDRVVADFSGTADDSERFQRQILRLLGALKKLPPRP
jgi:hypothetical protein